MICLLILPKNRLIINYISWTQKRQGGSGYRHGLEPAKDGTRRFRHQIVDCKADSVLVQEAKGSDDKVEVPDRAR